MEESLSAYRARRAAEQRQKQTEQDAQAKRDAQRIATQRYNETHRRI
jgi:hypothetical protein